MVSYALVFNFMIAMACYIYRPSPLSGFVVIFNVITSLIYAISYCGERASHAKELALLLQVAARMYRQLKIPYPAHDGDCLLTPEVTREIAEVGWRCETITVTGYSVNDVILWMHEVTCVTLGNGQTRIVDLTATQYDAHLPAVWITTFDDYAQRLAFATGAYQVRR